MLKNYSKNCDGVIFQIKKTPIKYNLQYSSEYEKYDDCISYLRLGYIIGTIGYVPENILDVGYGNGSFLKTCSKIIPNCYGNDISGYAIPEGCTFISDISSKFFEVITFFDSLEHFEDIEFVNKLKCKYVCISVPCCHYVNDEWFKNWKHRKPDEHLFHFNRQTLNNFMLRMGFKNISSSNIEDVIRVDKTDEYNILTSVFEKL